ncbi:MAG TPA: methionine aminotransferase [Flavisolibacter sp.]|nr:methionine aminotransferase [Chitinophagaceae bacterium]HZH00005.1 methionine aminotransferase [Flavisolibacter sp.]
MSTPTIHSKLPHVGTTIFTVMSSLALEHKAINLGQGFPDFPMNEELVSLVSEAMKGGWNQYTHMAGYMPLRESIAEKILSLYGTAVNPETDVTVTPGGTYAIYTAMTTVLQPGDEVIVFEPAYDSYIPTIESNGAIAIKVELRFPDYSIDWNLVRQKLTVKTKMIVINSPHNPTGAVLSKEDIEELKLTVAGTDIIIVSDEVYEHLIYDGLQHQSILRHADLLERSFVCFSFGKTYHCTGWKIGYCVSSATLMKEFRKIHQFNCFSCDTPKQVALSNILGRKELYLSLGEEMQKKRDYLVELLTATAFVPLKSNGSYFQCYSYANISEEDETTFVMRVSKEFGVTLIPVAAFYSKPVNNKVVRFCFAKKSTTLEEAAKRLSKL